MFLAKQKKIYKGQVHEKYRKECQNKKGYDNASMT